MNILEILNMLKEDTPTRIIGYHGSSKKFDKFDKSKIDSGTGDGGMYGPGFYFTDSVSLAKAWNDRGYVYKCELTFNKPYILDPNNDSYEEFKKLIKSDYINNRNTWDMTEFFKAGYDGIISKNEHWERNKNRTTKNSQYVVFDPKQIRILKIGKY